MNILYIKNFLKWFIIFLICFTLFFATFIPSNNLDNKKDLIKIDKYSLKISDLENITLNIIKNKKKIKKIDSVKNKLYFLIKQNILFNVNLLNSGLIVSKKEMLNTLFKIQSFNYKGVFSIDLYNSFLKKNNIIDFSFQESLKKESIQNQIKKCLLLIEKNKTFKKKKSIKFLPFKINYQKYFFKKNLNFKKNSSNYFLINTFNYKYVEFSINSLKKKILLKINKLNDFYNEKKHIYCKQNIFKTNYKFFNNKFKDKKLLVTKDELNNINITKIENCNKINDFASIKIKNKNNYTINKINKDLINKYVKQKIYNFLKKNLKKNIKNIEILSFVKNFDLKYKIIDLLNINSNILLKNYLNNNINGLIKINKNKYLFLLESKRKKIMYFLDLFINKKLCEKNILINFLKFKKNKKSLITWRYKANKNKKVRRLLDKLSTNDNIFLKYKDGYYFIQNLNFKFNDFTEQYFLIKNALNEKYNKT